jgi:ATP-dependent protease HslVU (ClpYQ) peptidase subunit
MTVICASITAKHVALGGDSGAFDDVGTLKMAASTPKVFRIGNHLIGGAGSFRVLNLVAKATDGDPESLRDFLQKELQGSDPGSWSVLVASAAGIYEIADDFSIITFRDSYAAIGAGAEIATGALASLSSLEGWDARQIVNDALAVTAKHSTMCTAPFKVYSYKV